MSAPFLLQVAAAGDRDFQTRVGQAARTVALAVADEAPTTPNHPQRRAFGNRVLMGEISDEVLARAMAADGATRNTLTDNQLANRLGAIWNALAIR